MLAGEQPSDAWRAAASLVIRDAENVRADAQSLQDSVLGQTIQALASRIPGETFPPETYVLVKSLEGFL